MSAQRGIVRPFFLAEIKIFCNVNLYIVSPAAKGKCFLRATHLDPVFPALERKRYTAAPTLREIGEKVCWLVEVDCIWSILIL